MKKEKIILFSIIIIGLILRLLCLDKIGGLWYDEIVSYKEAVKVNALSVIYYTLKTDVHLPLYQLFLHWWGMIFSFSDYSLRLFSVITGVLTVIVSYFTGKELCSKKTGLFCACIFTINSFLIYYSQEVRMYSFLILLASLQLLFLIRIKKRNNKIDYIFFTLFTAALIYTQTIGFIYVIQQIAIFIAFLAISKNSTYTKSLINSSFWIFVLSLPLIFYMSLNSANYTNQINGYYCDWSTLFAVIQDIFTPVLVSITENPIHYISELCANIDLSKIIFIFLPLGISIYGVFNALKKDKFSYVIFFSAAAFFITEIIAFKTTNFKIMSRYLSIIVPCMLVLSGYGLSIINKKYISAVLMSLLLVINFTYFIISPNAAFKLPRNGFKPLAEMLTKTEINSGDVVIVWNRKEILDKYIKDKIVVLSILKDFAYKSEVLLSNEHNLNKMSTDKRKATLHQYFTADKIPQNTHLLINFIYNNMQPGQKLFITTNTYFDNYNNLHLTEQEYSQISYNNLLTVKSLIDIKTLCFKKFNFIKKEQKNDYIIYVFAK